MIKFVLTWTILKPLLACMWLLGQLITLVARGLSTRTGRRIAAVLFIAGVAVWGLGQVASSGRLWLLPTTVGGAVVALGVWLLAFRNGYLAQAVRVKLATWHPVQRLRGMDKRTVTSLNDKGAKLGEYIVQYNEMRYDPRQALQPGRVALGTAKLKPSVGMPAVPVALAAETQRHTLVVAPSRGLKTTGVLLPNLLGSGLANACVVTTDPKGELLRNTYAWRTRTGAVTVYDPARVQQHVPSRTWSLVQYLQRAATPQEMYDRAASQSDALMSGAKSTGAEHADFFNTQASLLLTPMLVALGFDADKGMSDLLRWAAGAGAPDHVEEVLGILRSYVDVGGDAMVIDDWMGFAQMDEKPRGSTYMTVNGALRAFKRGDVRASSDIGPGTRPFDAREFLTRPGTHYLIGNERLTKELRGLYVAHLNELLTEAREVADANGGHLPIPLVVVLEEAANMGCLPTLPDDLSVDAGRNIWYLTVVQSFSQIKSVWGEDGLQKILSNTHAKLLLSGEQDELSRRWLESKGKIQREVETTSFDEDGKKSGASSSTRDQALVASHVLEMMPPGHGILSYQRTPLVPIQVEHYSNNARMLARVLSPEATWEQDLADGLVRVPQPADFTASPAVGQPAWLAAARAQTAAARRTADVGPIGNEPAGPRPGADAAVPTTGGAGTAGDNQWDGYDEPSPFTDPDGGVSDGEDLFSADSRAALIDLGNGKYADPHTGEVVLDASS